MKGKKDIRKIVALDFASTGLRAIVAEVSDDDKLRILSSEHRKADAIKHGIIGHPTGTAFNVTSLLKELTNSAKLKHPIKEFSLALSGRAMRVVQAVVEKSLGKDKEITDKMLDEMATEAKESYQADKMLVYDTIPVYYELDGKFVDEPEGMKARNIQAYYNLIVGSAQIHTQFQKCMERISYESREDHIFLMPEAIVYAVAQEEERKEGCAIIHMGDTTTTLAIYQDEILQYMLTVPFGGGSITKDIEEMGIEEAYAEKLKCKFGLAAQSLVDKDVQIMVNAIDESIGKIPVKQSFLSMIIESRLDEIFQPILQALDQYDEEIPHGIILTGGAAKLQGMVHYLTEKIDMPVRLGSHAHLLSKDSAEKYHDMIYTQLVGILNLTHDERENTEYIEDEKKPRKQKKPLQDKITQGFFRFFGEENESNDNEK